MHKVLRFDLFSAARLFALVYGLIGLVLAPFGAVESHQIYIPVGFEIPYVRLMLRFNLATTTSWTADICLLLLAILCFAATGAITGTVLGFTYNLTSGIWGGVKARTANQAIN